MDIYETILLRHSVRRYTDKPIDADIIGRLNDSIAECNSIGNLHMQLVIGEPKAFQGTMAHYGKFSGVNNYIALIGRKSPSLEERCGYYGEKIVLQAQQEGLNSCWVGLTYSKVPGAFAVGKGEKTVAVIALGYGLTQGIEHASKPIEKVALLRGGEPEWFMRGVRAALLAPTAMNQQKFRFGYVDGKVSATTSWGFYAKVDLGIAKYHFEISAGREIEWL